MYKSQLVSKLRGQPPRYIECEKCVVYHHHHHHWSSVDETEEAIATYWAQTFLSFMSWRISGGSKPISFLTVSGYWRCLLPLLAFPPGGVQKIRREIGWLVVRMQWPAKHKRRCLIIDVIGGYRHIPRCLGCDLSNWCQIFYVTVEYNIQWFCLQFSCW